MPEQEIVSLPTIKPLLGEFPTDTLPEWVRAFVEHSARALGVPTDLIAIPVLVDISVGIGNNWRIQLKPSYQESASVYGAIIGNPGVMKSPALQAGLRSLRFPHNAEPGNRRFTSDVTTEKLAELLDKHPRGILLYRDELSAWVRAMNQYRSGKGADRQFYLQARGGSPLTVDRINGTDIFVLHPFLSIVGTIQPDMLSELEDAHGREDGFLARPLYAWPDPVPVRWTDEEVPDAVISEYDRHLQALYDLPDNDEPVVLSLTPAAKGFFTDWHDVHCEEGENANFSSFMQAVYSKLKGYCGRLALIHAVTSNPDTVEVDVESIAAAAAQIEYFKRQAFKVDAALPQKKNDPLEQCKTAIRRRLSTCRHLKKRVLQRRIHCTAEIFNQALTEMSRAEIRIDENTNVIWNEVSPDIQETIVTTQNN